MEKSFPLIQILKKRERERDLRVSLNTQKSAGEILPRSGSLILQPSVVKIFEKQPPILKQQQQQQQIWLSLKATIKKMRYNKRYFQRS